MRTGSRVFGALLLSVSLAAMMTSGCGGDDDDGGAAGAGGSGGRPTNTGAACMAPSDCYPGVVNDGGMVQGEVLCLDRVDDGYCTHRCTSDSDCCSVTGECEAGIDQVCSPFESTGDMMCFVSCEGSVLPSGTDEQSYCQAHASPDFICRSSGGGSNNRKICVPGDCGVGEDCSADTDCATGLNCLTGFRGGYCAKQDCGANADCPNGSLCVDNGDGNRYCLRTCAGNSDCSFCRAPEFAATCSNTALFVETGTTGSVCVPPL